MNIIEWSIYFSLIFHFQNYQSDNTNTIENQDFKSIEELTVSWPQFHSVFPLIFEISPIKLFVGPVVAV